MEKRKFLYDCTLREGAQGEGVSYSVEDKLKIAAALDEFGIAYIEAGNPFSNPKDEEFFQRAKAMKLKNAVLCAFGSTCRKGVRVDEDENLAALLRADTPVVTVFGKASRFQAERVLNLSPEENLKLIAETVGFLKSKGRRVFFDAEHFFDGCAYGDKYPFEVLRAAINSGAERVILCDTNGGTLPDEAYKIMYECRDYDYLGVHFHNDIGCASANTLLAAKLGFSVLQGTFIGNGERCGNADLSVIVPTLTEHCRIDCGVKDLTKLTALATEIYEISNLRQPSNKPYTGKNAFAHKGGMHIDGMSKSSASYEHISPAKVGNERHFLVSELSGRGSVLLKIENLDFSLKKDSPATAAVLKRLKEMEHIGYQYEGADASFELLVLDVLGRYTPHFNLVSYRTEVIKPADGDSSRATLEISVDGMRVKAEADGNGPVNALDLALRKALSIAYPKLKNVRLTDYKVRVLGGNATGSTVRVFIESTDGESVWTTVGVSTDIIEASFFALVDSIEYILYKKGEE